MSFGNNTIRLYRHALSGHCHRVELMLSLLGLRSEMVDVDLLQGAHKRPEFLVKNPWGQIPVLEDGDFTLADSNAILVYLVSRYAPDGPWLPRDPLGQARVQRWFSVAAGPLASGPATLRAAAVFQRTVDEQPLRVRSTQLLDVLAQELGSQAFLLGTNPTLADVAMYAYVARAPEGGVSLAGYPQVRAWLGRIEQLPGFVPMAHTRTRHVEHAEA
jgi:glutathione S-transferase